MEAQPERDNRQMVSVVFDLVGDVLEKVVSEAGRLDLVVESRIVQLDGGCAAEDPSRDYLLCVVSPDFRNGVKATARCCVDVWERVVNCDDGVEFARCGLRSALCVMTGGTDRPLWLHGATTTTESDDDLCLVQVPDICLQMENVYARVWKMKLERKVQVLTPCLVQLSANAPPVTARDLEKYYDLALLLYRDLH